MVAWESKVRVTQFVVFSAVFFFQLSDSVLPYWRNSYLLSGSLQIIGKIIQAICRDMGGGLGIMFIHVCFFGCFNFYFLYVESVWGALLYIPYHKK